MAKPNCKRWFVVYCGEPCQRSYETFDEAQAELDMIKSCFPTGWTRDNFDNYWCIRLFDLHLTTPTVQASEPEGESKC